MIHISLEEASVEESERYNDIAEDTRWEPIATSQGNDMDRAKALMLENILEMLNNEELFPEGKWLRLIYSDTDSQEVTNVEVF